MTLSIPLELVPEGGLMAVTLHTKQLKGGRARVYRDEIRVLQGRPWTRGRAGKIRLDSQAEAEATLPRLHRAVACELIATLTQTPWNGSWDNTAAQAQHRFETVGFWTGWARSRRLTEARLEAVLELFQSVPELGGPDRDLIMAYLKHHGNDPDRALQTTQGAPPVCGAAECLLERALLTPRHQDSAQERMEAVFEEVVEAAQGYCADRDAQLAEVASGAGTCPGLLSLREVLREEADGWWEQENQDPDGWWWRDEVVHRALVEATQVAERVLRMGSSGATAALLRGVVSEGLEAVQDDITQ